MSRNKMNSKNEELREWENPMQEAESESIRDEERQFMLDADVEDQTPKIFWKYYDLYRRKIITLEEFSNLSNMRISELKAYLQRV